MDTIHWALCTIQTMHYTAPCTMRGGRRSHCALIDRTGQPPTFSELRNSAISNDWHGVAIINSKDMVTMMMILMMMAMVMIAHFLFMTRLLDGDMQLTLMSVVPCRLQIAIEKRPKFARITFEGTYLEDVQGSAERMTIIIIIIIIITVITLIVWSAAHDMVSFSPSHLYAVLYFVPSGPTPVKMKRFKIFRISYGHFYFVRSGTYRLNCIFAGRLH